MLGKRQKTEVLVEGMTLVDHLAELRRRIIVIISTLVLGVIVGFYYSPSIVDYVMRIPGELVFLYPGEAFIVHLTVALVFGIVVDLPIILYQVVRFLVPGLREKEVRALFLGLPFSLGMFALGIVFAYKGILPLAYRFFMGFGTEHLAPLISIGNYVSFVLGLIVPFGIVFQLPLIVLLLAGVGILHPHTLVRYRKYIILVIVILAAVLTPPDVVSQMLMAIPMVLLYELSILLCRIVFRKRLADNKEEK
ncbi:MAG TPA: twin-arginine translocase subunit TatC [Firmicutes bacterium]|nr:twin-arginine translocase subunit TatC [Bacillota bacterium]